MIDPMADIGSGFDPTKSNGSGEGGGTEILNFHALQLNHRKIDYVQSFMGIVSGCVAGICRFTGLEGLACFLVLHLVVTLALLSKMNFRLKSYSQKNIIAFLTNDLQSCALSFMLFWTLFYGLVYLF